MKNMVLQYISPSDLDQFVHLKYVDAINIGQNNFILKTDLMGLRIKFDTATETVQAVRVRPYSKDINNVPAHGNYDTHEYKGEIIVFEYLTDIEGNLLIEFFDFDGVDSISYKGGYK